jgi:hypothetical protein
MPDVKALLAYKNSAAWHRSAFARARDQREREPHRHPIVTQPGTLDQRPIMFFKRIDPLISATRALVGDLLWTEAIGFILAIIFGVIGASPPP